MSIKDPGESNASEDAQRQLLSRVSREMRTPLVAVIGMAGWLPEVDGFAASAAIRAREGGGRRIPIVAMTAGTMPGDRDRCLAAGMDDYVAKPFNADALDGVLRRWTESAAASS